jgi:hypothetical protein
VVPPVVVPPAGEHPDAAPPRRRSLRSRVKESDLDLRNTWQVAAGAILLPLGVAVILLGWSGAAHQRVDQGQIPYLISGGLLGLATVIVGCFFFWAHWLYRIYDQADLHHQQAMREQNDLMRTLLDALQSRGLPVAVGSNGAAPPGPRRNYVGTATGANFHTPTCPVVANKEQRAVSAEEASHMRPCRICEPLELSN